MQDRGNVRNFPGSGISLFLVQSIHFFLKMGNWVFNSLLLPCFNRTQGLVTFVCGSFLFANSGSSDHAFR